MIIIDDALTTVLVDEYKLGRHSWDLAVGDPVRFTLLLSSRATVTMTAIVWTKTAFAVTLLRLTDGGLKKLLWFIIISMNIAMGLTCLFFWIPCTPLEKAWRPTRYLQTGSCWDPLVLQNYNIFSGGKYPPGALDGVSRPDS